MVGVANFNLISGSSRVVIKNLIFLSTFPKGSLKKSKHTNSGFYNIFSTLLFKF